MELANRFRKISEVNMMQKSFLISSLLVFLSLSLFSQELSGIYRFSHPELDQGNLVYIKFGKNNFVCFSLGSNTKVIDGVNELKEIGTGKYSFAKDNLILDFKTDSTIILPYSYDSVSVSFSSKENQLDIKVSIEFKSVLTKFELASLIVETPLKEYHELINRDLKKVITLPRGSIIKSIKLAAVGMPLKYLPFDVNFNTIDYVFFAKDHRSAINIFKNQLLTVKIDKKTDNSVYSFGHSRLFLVKINVLESEFLQRLSKGEEPRLIKLLNYSF